MDKMSRALSAQIQALADPKEVEVLSYTDNREKTTGYKRNVLINKAKGKFIVFVDDDDKLSNDYIKLITDVIRENPNIDGIGIRGKYSEDGKPYQPFETSLKHNWEFTNGWYYRTLNHISPIKREHAKKVQFPDKTIGEDYAWTMKLKETGLLKKEVVIKEYIYFYDFVSNKNY